jgi:hypothetical protein
MQACLYKLVDRSIAVPGRIPQAPSLTFGSGAWFVSRPRSREQKKEGLFFDVPIPKRKKEEIP